MKSRFITLPLVCACSLCLLIAMTMTGSLAQAATHQTSPKVSPHVSCPPPGGPHQDQGSWHPSFNPGMTLTAIVDYTDNGAFGSHCDITLNDFKIGIFGGSGYAYVYIFDYDYTTYYKGCIYINHNSYSGYSLNVSEFGGFSPEFVTIPSCTSGNRDTHQLPRIY